MLHILIKWEHHLHTRTRTHTKHTDTHHIITLSYCLCNKPIYHQSTVHTPSIASAVVVPESLHHDKIFILRQHLQDRFTTTTKTARHTTGTQQRPISADTVRRRSASNNIRCRRPARGPILTNRFRQERLQWATASQHWRYQQWRSVLFSDESRFCISTVDGRVRVWRRRCERYADACVKERDTWDGQSIMVWGAIGISHKAGPVIFQNINPGRGNGVTALRYINQVLRLHIVSYFGRHQHHVFRQDNARAPHCQSHQGPSPTAQHQNHSMACRQSGFESNRALVGRNLKKTQ